MIPLINIHHFVDLIKHLSLHLSKINVILVQIIGVLVLKLLNFLLKIAYLILLLLQ